MKPIQILVTVALVGCGILLYDTFRGPPPAPVPVDVPVLDRPAPPTDGGGGERVPTRATLQGPGIEVFANRLEELEARIDNLEASLRRRGTSPGAGSGSAAGSGLQRPESLADVEAGGAVPSAFTEEEIAWFRALNEEVLRIRREESEIRSIRAQLDRIRTDFPDDVRDQLVEETRQFRAQKRDILGQALREHWSVERRQQELETARDTYQERVYRLAPGDGEEVLRRFGNFPGYRLDGPFARDR